MKEYHRDETETARRPQRCKGKLGGLRGGVSGSDDKRNPEDAGPVAVNRKAAKANNITTIEAKVVDLDGDLVLKSTIRMLDGDAAYTCGPTLGRRYFPHSQHERGTKNEPMVKLQCQSG